LSELQLWFSQRKNLKLASAETRKELLGAEEQFKAIGNKFRELLKTSNCSIAAKNMSAALVELEQIKTTKEQEFQLVEQEKRHWQLKNKLEEFAADLKEGAPCPICGSTEHPEIINSEEAKAEINKIEKKLNLLDAEVKNLTTCLGNARVIIAQAGERNRALEEKKVELKEKEDRQKEYDTTFAGKNYGIEDEAKLVVAVKELEKSEEVLQKLRALT
jgi:exonuclease SbcC